MGKFLNGLLIGAGVGLLIAPKKGEETRHLLTERFQSLQSSVAGKGQSPSLTQQAADRFEQATNSAAPTNRPTTSSNTTTTADFSRQAATPAGNPNRTTGTASSTANPARSTTNDYLDSAMDAGADVKRPGQNLNDRLK